MNPLKSLFIVCILFCLLGGCSTKQDLIVPPLPSQDQTILLPENRELIVLLPDPDGEVGTLQVTTDGGSQTLEKPGHGTRIESFSKPPSAPLALDENIMGTIRNRKSSEVYITGLTDRVGTEVYNLRFSSRGSNYVRDQLLSAGGKSSTLVVSFRCETAPW